MNTANAVDKTAGYREAGVDAEQRDQSGRDLEKRTFLLRIRSRLARGDWLYFVVVFLGLCGMLGSAATAFLSYSENVAQQRFKAVAQEVEFQTVEAMRRAAAESLIRVTTDLFVVRDIATRALAQSDAAVPDLSAVGDTFVDFLRSHGNFTQLTVFDAGGRELLRVERRGNESLIVPADAVIDGTGIDMLAQVRALPADRVLLGRPSPRLRRVTGDSPPDPVYRLITRIPGHEGFVALDHRAREVLESIDTTGGGSPGTAMVVTARGIELLERFRAGSPEATRALRDRPIFSERFRSAWDAMLGQARGVVIDDEGGIMVFVRHSPADVQAPETLGGGNVTWTQPNPDEPDSEDVLYLVSEIKSDLLNAFTDIGLTRSAEVRATIAAMIIAISGLAAFGMRDLRRRNYRMGRLATRDSLTGVCNRGEFDRRLEESMAHAQRYRRTMALLIIDMDDFKAVNDGFGHATGDELLRYVARILQESLRASDIVGRIGGDEFAVVLREIEDHGDTVAVVELLSKLLRGKMNLDGQKVPVSASIGGATYPGDGLELAQLFAAADEAMYEFKQRRKSGS